MAFNIKFKEGKVHKISVFSVFGPIRLVCGLVAKGIIDTKHNWHLTTKGVDCENCLRKSAGPKPTDLSNYHTFVK